MLTLTDGPDDDFYSMLNMIDVLRAPPYNIHNWVSISVGPAFYEVTIQMVALAGNNSANVFKFDYQQLVADISDIAANVCDPDLKVQCLILCSNPPVLRRVDSFLKAVSPCGEGCCGFCMCSTCASPIKCDDYSRCTSSEGLVASASPGLQCCSLPQAKTCLASDKCHVRLLQPPLLSSPFSSNSMSNRLVFLLQFNEWKLH